MAGPQRRFVVIVLFKDGSGWVDPVRGLKSAKAAVEEGLGELDAQVFLYEGVLGARLDALDVHAL